MENGEADLLGFGDPITPPANSAANGMVDPFVSSAEAVPNLLGVPPPAAADSVAGDLLSMADTPAAAATPVPNEDTATAAVVSGESQSNPTPPAVVKENETQVSNNTPENSTVEVVANETVNDTSTPPEPAKSSLALSESTTTQQSPPGATANVGSIDSNSNNQHQDDKTSQAVMIQQLQAKLEAEMSLKAEAENSARLAATEIQELKQMYNQMADEIQDFHAVRSSLEGQVQNKAEAEDQVRRLQGKMSTLEAETTNWHAQLQELTAARDASVTAAEEAETTARAALERVDQLEQTKSQLESQVTELQEKLDQAQRYTEAQQAELEKLKEERDELGRQEVALKSRLNGAKMKEADKTNLVEQFEADLRASEKELKTTRASLLDLQAEKQRLEQDMQSQSLSSDERVRKAQQALAEERRLNEERKRKMKVFVETKAEELRQSKADQDTLQVEADQANRSLLELNHRWKQLHAQYVQSQTRNRELQRDLNRIKKDSENLHKVGDTLEMKLSKSANETEEHKNKRLAAKNELMAVLKTLEAEKKVTSRLRDAIKFTFTPKALSQQQLIQESMDDFEAQLQKLAQRLGRPLPPAVSDDSMPSESSNSDSGRSAADLDFDRLIAKLERETQAVSKSIVALSGNVERMHLVLDASGDRNCVTALTDIILGNVPVETNANGDTTNDNVRTGRLTSRHRYGSVPSAVPKYD